MALWITAPIPKSAKRMFTGEAKVASTASRISRSHAFAAALELALMAPSLGGVETLVSQPRHTSHIHFSEAMRAGMGIPDGFVRISVGLEDVEDLKEDFGRALAGLR